MRGRALCDCSNQPAAVAKSSAAFAATPCRSSSSPAAGSISSRPMRRLLEQIDQLRRGDVRILQDLAQLLGRIGGGGRRLGEERLRRRRDRGGRARDRRHRHWAIDGRVAPDSAAASAIAIAAAAESRAEAAALSAAAVADASHVATAFSTFSRWPPTSSASVFTESARRLRSSSIPLSSPITASADWSAFSRWRVRTASVDMEYVACQKLQRWFYSVNTRPYSDDGPMDGLLASRGLLSSP